MSSTPRAARSALVVLVGLIGIASVASAQRHPIRIGRAGSPPPQPTATTPYPGATVTIDPFLNALQGEFLQRRRNEQRHDRFFDQRHDRFFDQRRESFFDGVPAFIPSYGSAGAVYDTNGRPLYNGYAYEAPAPAPAQYNDFPAATPDLSGSPYVVIDGGTMIVDFGNGDRRAVPACAVVEAASTPDGQPRTLFYRPPAYQLILRPGQRGQVLGKPTAGARVCYTNDAYGRVVLAY